MKLVKETSNLRKLELIQKTCLSNTELMELASCGYKAGMKIRKEIEDSINPLKLPKRIPTSLVVKYLMIDVDLLIKTTYFTNNQEAHNETLCKEPRT